MYYYFDITNDGFILTLQTVFLSVHILYKRYFYLTLQEDIFILTLQKDILILTLQKMFQYLHYKK